MLQQSVPNNLMSIFMKLFACIDEVRISFLTIFPQNFIKGVCNFGNSIFETVTWFYIVIDD